MTVSSDETVEKRENSTEKVEKTEKEHLEVPDSSDDVTDQRKIDILKAIEKCEAMGGEDFEAEQERILRELNKQKETIRGLLDEMQMAKKERETHNIQSIFGK